MKGKIVWVGRTECSYELGSNKKDWKGVERGFQPYIEMFCRRSFESITGFKLKPGEGPIAVRISVKRAGRKRK